MACGLMKERYVCIDKDGLVLEAHSHNYGCYSGGYFLDYSKACEYALHMAKRLKEPVTVSQVVPHTDVDVNGDWSFVGVDNCSSN